MSLPPCQSQAAFLTPVKQSEPTLYLFWTRSGLSEVPPSCLPQRWLVHHKAPNAPDRITVQQTRVSDNTVKVITTPHSSQTLREMCGSCRNSTSIHKGSSKTSTLKHCLTMKSYLKPSTLTPQALNKTTQSSEAPFQPRLCRSAGKHRGLFFLNPKSQVNRKPRGMVMRPSGATRAALQAIFRFGSRSCH